MIAVACPPRKFVVSFLGDDVAASRVRDIFRSNLDRLLEERRVKGITAEKLAEKIGVKAQKLSQWRNGEYFPRAEQIDKIADALEINVESLFRENVVVETRDLDAAVHELASALGYRLSKKGDA